MPHFELFLALWLLTLLASEHALANRGIVLGENLPNAVAWLVRCAYLVGAGGVAFAFLSLCVATVGAE